MSFLDEQATGQIGIGEKANLSTLTRRKRKRKKGQAPTGSETYSLMPQDEFSNIVSSPTDLQQVGIGNLLQAQGDSAGKVPNVFEEYDSAAPLLGTKEAVYYQPPDEEEEEEEEEDLPSVENDPMRNFSPDSNIYDPDTQTGLDYAKAEDAREAFVTTAYQSAFATPRTPAEEFRSIVQGVTGSARSLGRDISKQDFESHAKAVEESRNTDGTSQFGGGEGALGPDPSVAAPADVPGFGEGYGVGGSGYSGGESSAGGWTPFASGGTVKVKKSFMSMKGK